MIVEPYKTHPAPPRIGVLVDHTSYLDETHAARPLASLEPGERVYASQDVALELVRAGHGHAFCWNANPIRLELPDATVRVIGLPFPPDAVDAVDGLATWRDWLAAEGAAPQGSLGGSAFSLLRAKLEQTLWTTVPAAQAPPIPYTIGGRQELGPQGAPVQLDGQLRHYDMRAAYASTLGTLAYGGHWRRVKPHERFDLVTRAGLPVFARARVTLPAGLELGPLIRRPRAHPAPIEQVFGGVASYPTSGTLQGVWTWQELAAALDHGARIKILDAWVHASGGRLPFLPWWNTIEQGRELPGFASLLAKATGNALWGQFCITRGQRSTVSYLNGRRTVRNLPRPRGGRRPAHDLSELLTGQVRARLYRFMAAAGPQLVTAHTDGGWTAGDFTYPEWRSKDTATRIRVLDPQLLAYTRPTGQEVYCVAGWPAALADDLFEQAWQRRGARAA